MHALCGHWMNQQMPPSKAAVDVFQSLTLTRSTNLMPGQRFTKRPWRPTGSHRKTPITHLTNKQPRVYSQRYPRYSQPPIHQSQIENFLRKTPRYPGCIRKNGSIQIHPTTPVLRSATRWRGVVRPLSIDAATSVMYSLTDSQVVAKSRSKSSCTLYRLVELISLLHAVIAARFKFDWLIMLRFYVPSDTKFRRRSSQPISWLSSQYWQSIRKEESKDGRKGES